MARINKEAKKEKGEIINNRSDKRVVKRACLSRTVIALRTYFSER